MVVSLKVGTILPSHRSIHRFMPCTSIRTNTQGFDRAAYLAGWEARGLLGLGARSQLAIIGRGARVVGCPRVVNAFVGEGAGGWCRQDVLSGWMGKEKGGEER